MGKKVGRREPDRVAELTARVEALTARLEALESAPPPSQNGNGHDKAPHSRRDLLKLAGAAAAGAAGSVLLGSVPAAATNGSAVLLGNSTTNDAGTTTDLFPTTATFPSPLFQATGQGVPANTTVPATVSATGPATQSIPLIGAIGPGGQLPLVGSPTPIRDYPGFAPIQGVGGNTTVTFSDGSTKTYSEGVDGWGAGNTGIGVSGESDIGYGVAGGSGGIDIAAIGNGRFLQLSLPDKMLTTPAGPAPTFTPSAGPPKYTPNQFEQARDGSGILWLSSATGTWRRVNSTIPISPFRVYDSRPYARPANSVTVIQIAGVNGIPPDAIGVLGNLTALGPAADGYLQMFPTGSALGQFNNVNYFRGVAALSNFVTVALGNGQVSVYVSGNGPTNFLFDVSGYIQ
jgi:hypothetical protein